MTVDVGEAEQQMAVLALTGTEQVHDSPLRVQGMRAACSRPVSFDNLAMDGGDFLGAPGDYLREPDFSTGAWRTTAVTFGGLEALVELAVAQLKARGRDADPHQRARIGQALIAQETARLWGSKAAVTGESATIDPADAVAYVTLARLAVETACLDAMRLMQRSLGLAAFDGSTRWSVSAAIWRPICANPPRTRPWRRPLSISCGGCRTRHAADRLNEGRGVSAAASHTAIRRSGHSAGRSSRADPGAP